MGSIGTSGVGELLSLFFFLHNEEDILLYMLGCTMSWEIQFCCSTGPSTGPQIGSAAKDQPPNYPLQTRLSQSLYCFPTPLQTRLSQSLYCFPHPTKLDFLKVCIASPTPTKLDFLKDCIPSHILLLLQLHLLAIWFFFLRWFWIVRKIWHVSWCFYILIFGFFFLKTMTAVSW